MVYHYHFLINVKLNALVTPAMTARHVKTCGREALPEKCLQLE